MSAQKITRLEGTPNFRDLGGLSTVDGRTLRHGVLFRSEGPAYLNANDVATLQGLGIRTVCDLRSEGERLAQPNQWCDAAALFNIPVDSDVRVKGNKAWDLMRADPTVEGGRAAMMYNYREMGRVMEPPFRALIDRLLSGAGVPVLVHCTAGKDRTGVIIALLLHALGVPTSQIEADYVLSARHMGVTRFADGLRRMFDELGIIDPPAELLAMPVGVEVGYLDCAMQEIVRDTVTLDRFFEERISLDKSRRTALRDLLLETPA
jgi:protein-tyrosine phosphatase